MNINYGFAWPAPQICTRTGGYAGCEQLVHTKAAYDALKALAFNEGLYGQAHTHTHVRSSGPEGMSNHSICSLGWWEAGRDIRLNKEARCRKK